MTTTNSTHTPLATDAIHALCQRLQLAAIRTQQMDIHLSYSPHVKILHLYAYSEPVDYSSDIYRPERAIDAIVSIDDDDALSRLQATVDQLQRLGVEV